MDTKVEAVLERADAISADSTYQSAFSEIKAQMLIDDQSLNKSIEARFAIGKIVCALQESKTHGDEAVKKLSADLTTSLQYTVHPQRLWECGRVYKTFGGDINKIWDLEKKLQVKLTWSYILNNCTKEPTLGEPAIVHYEKKISQWEKTIDEIEDARENKDEIMRKIPEEARNQIEGFFERVKTQGIVLPPIENTPNDKLNVLFDKVDQLLTEIVEVRKIAITKEMRWVLENITAKINQILEYQA